MTLAQMQYYTAVCKYQSLTKAAKELLISQPAMSVAMRELEAECGFPLFERGPNSIRVTEQGHALLREIEQMMLGYQRLQNNTKLIAEQKSVLRIGVATMGAGRIFSKIRRDFYEAHPEITFEVKEDSTEELYRKVDDGELDFAFCVSIRLPDKHYRYVTVGNSRLMFCVHKNDPLAKRRVESLGQLGETPLVMLSDRYSQTKYLKRLFRQAKFEPNVIQYTAQVFTILQMIRENAAGGFLSEEIAGYLPDAMSFALHEVDMASITIIWRKDRNRFLAMDDFIRYIQRYKV